MTHLRVPTFQAKRYHARSCPRNAPLLPGRSSSAERCLSDSPPDPGSTESDSRSAVRSMLVRSPRSTHGQLRPVSPGGVAEVLGCSPNTAPRAGTNRLLEPLVEVGVDRHPRRLQVLAEILASQDRVQMLLPVAARAVDRLRRVTALAVGVGTGVPAHEPLALTASGDLSCSTCHDHSPSFRVAAPK